MAQAGWEKPISTSGDFDRDAAREKLLKSNKGMERLKFVVGALILGAAIFALIASGTLSGARFFISVDEVVNDAQYAGQSVRITGAVLGESIVIDESDPSNITISFTIVNIEDGYTNLADALHEAVNDTSATRLNVFVSGQPKPELLQHEAQAILTGTLGGDGVFYASALQFKCPSRFEVDGPTMGGEDHPGMQFIPNTGADAGAANAS